MPEFGTGTEAEAAPPNHKKGRMSKGEIPDLPAVGTNISPTQCPLNFPSSCTPANNFV